MKKIFLLLVTACALTACDPVHEDISNDGNITLDQLKSMSSVTTDKANDGQNGNVITCTTSAPVNAKWTIAGKDYTSNYATKKMKLGDHTVTLTALCADGTLLTTDFSVSCQEITDPLTKYYIYGEDPVKQPAFTPGAWDAAAMRFSDGEGKYLPYLSDDVYWGFKTLIFDVASASDDCVARVMNGWWSATYVDKFVFKAGLNELTLTEQIAKDCAQGNGGSGKDLDIMVTSGTCTINSVYYEE